MQNGTLCEGKEFSYWSISVGHFIWNILKPEKHEMRCSLFENELYML